MYFFYKDKVHVRFAQKSLVILEKWLQSNMELKKIDQGIILKLASKTNLSALQVKNWIYNRRTKKARLQMIHIQSQKKRRQILKENFNLNKYPNKQDMVNIQKQTGMSEKKISLWFAKERFLFKKYCVRCLRKKLEYLF